jgi:aminoglycoside 3-N-acetyltransferase
MSEDDAIKATRGMPATIQSIQDDLSTLGVAPGMTLLVHSSLSSLGWVCGGAVAVVLALERAIGLDGTLVMPTHSGDLSEPSYWKHPPVPEEWWARIRQTMPPYETSMTPTRGVGAIPECFRNQPGTRRSFHPSDSFAARGPHAERIVNGHSLEFSMGDGSPLARVFDLDGWMLLLGADYQCASSLHLAEFRANYPKKKLVKRGAPIEVNGRREWVEYRDNDWSDSDFNAIGSAFEESTRLVRSGRVANAVARLMPQRQLIEFASRWMEKNRL